MGRICVTAPAQNIPKAVNKGSNNMSEESADFVQRESQIDAEGAGSDLEIERGGKQAKFDDEDSDNDSTVSSSNSNSTQASSTVGKRGFRGGKGRKKRSLAFRCVNFLKVTDLFVIFKLTYRLISEIVPQIKKLFPRNFNFAAPACHVLSFNG